MGSACWVFFILHNWHLAKVNRVGQAFSLTPFEI